MSSFIVSARKYRPQSFSEVKGQEHVTATLRNAIKAKKIAQAFLFCGLKGSGKTTSARLLAKAINCDATTAQGEPCNTCDSCVQFVQNGSFSIHELDAASHNSAEDMRNIVEQMRYHAPNGKKTVIIIDEAHMLSNAALNVLLKPLEDTPPHVVFMLVTTEKHKIIPTILSRCQVFDFRHIEHNEIEAQLKYIAGQENIQWEQDAITLIAQKAGGSLRDALSMFDLVVTFEGKKQLTYIAALQHLNLLREETFFKITDSLYKKNIVDALQQYHEIARTGFDSYQFIYGLTQHLRNILVAKSAQSLSLLSVRKSAQATYQKNAKDISTDFIYQALAHLQECQLHYRQSLHKQLHIELALIKVAQINQTKKEPATIVATLVAPTKKKGTSTTLPSNQPIVQPTTIASTSPTPKSTRPTPSAVVATPRNSTFKIPSMEEVEQQVVQKIIKQKESIDTSIKKELTIDTIKPHWEAYRVAKIKVGKDDDTINILTFPIELKDTTIIVILESPIQKSLLEEQKKELTLYLRKKLNHPTIAIDSRVEIKEREKIPYSDSEKLHYLINKYPQVATLQQKLGLDIH